MLIIDQDDQLEPLAGSDNQKCATCATRRATWVGAMQEGGTQVPTCAWCLLYAGSAWGHANRTEFLLMGPTIRQAAIASGNPKVHIPELDERHRLPPMDAERLMLGVYFTSVKLRKWFGMLRPISKMLGDE